jgi:hypothetical protein
MPPRKRKGDEMGAPAAARAGGSCQRIVENVDRAVMSKQPTGGGRVNACWVSPVVAVAMYYGCLDVTIESILALQGEGADEVAVAEDILWEKFYVGTTACFEQGEHWSCWDETGDPDVWFNGIDAAWKTSRPGMIVEEWGVESVCEEWFTALRGCIDSDNVALMLAERLEEGEARAHAKAAKATSTGAAGAGVTKQAPQGNVGARTTEGEAPPQMYPDRRGAAQIYDATSLSQRPTHYLLVLGYHVQSGRRGRKSYQLFLKDPMEGDRLITANLEAGVDGKMVLATTREDAAGMLDRFRPLQSYHFCGKFAPK